MLDILERICEGKGEENDIETLESLSNLTQTASLCMLGKTAANPVMSTLTRFRNEYEAHIRDKKCPAKVCKVLLSYAIDPEKCIGCTLCARKCPTQCINGNKKEPHVIDQERCIQCGQCVTTCRFDAVIVS